MSDQIVVRRCIGSNLEDNLNRWYREGFDIVSVSQVDGMADLWQVVMKQSDKLQKSTAPGAVTGHETEVAK